MIDELWRQRLAREVGRAGVLAAPALGARERVHHLLPRQVLDGPDAEAHLLLGQLLVEAQRLEPAARARAAEVDVDRRSRDVQVLGVRQVDEEAEDQQHVRPRERDRVGEVERQQRHDDRGDPGQDEVCLAEVAALEAARPDDLADEEGDAHADQREHAEDVGQGLVPVWSDVLVDDRDDRERDRREEDDEGPEDEGVHQPRDQSLQQLALTEHHDGLLAEAVGYASRRSMPEGCPIRTSRASSSTRRANQKPETANGGGQREAGDHPLTRRSSAVMAGTISSTSPITA